MSNALRRFDTVARLADTPWARQRPHAMRRAWFAACIRLQRAAHWARLDAPEVPEVAQLLQDRADQADAYAYQLTAQIMGR